MKIRYKRTILGYVWSVINPFAFAMTFYIAFRHALKMQTENYLVFLLAGMFPWQFFSNSVTNAPAVFLANANLIKKAKFPRYTLILSMIGNHAVHFLFALPVLVGFMVFSKDYISFFNLPLILVLFFNQLILIVGLALIISTANLFFRDMENLTVVLTSILFYLTPVIYKEELIPADFKFIFVVNPMVPVIKLWHQLLLSNKIEWPVLGISFGFNLVIFGIGLLVYLKNEKRFAEVV